MEKTALAEIDKAHAAALEAMTNVEKSTNGIVDQAQSTILDFNQKTLDTKNIVLDSFNSACEGINSNIRGLVPELKEMAVRAVKQAFSRIEELPDRFDKQLSNSRKMIQQRTTEQVHQIIDTANEKIGDARALTEKKKDELIETLGERLNDLTSGRNAVTGRIKATINDMIPKIQKETASAFSHEAESREAAARIDVAFHGLTISAGTMIDEISSNMENGIQEMRDEIENSINESFNELASLFEELPTKIEETARGIIDRVDSALNDINAQASGLIREMITGAREGLNEAVEAIGENIDGTIDRGMEIIQELRDGMGEALDGLVEQIRQFTEDTLNDIKNSANRILQTVREEIQKNIEAAREAVNETVLEMAGRMNRQIEKIKNDLSLEAEKQARELRVMGEEAYAEAEENYVNAGYTEDTSVIPDIRKKGEEITAEIERTVEEQADGLVQEFRSQADIVIPRITLQGAKLTAQAMGAGGRVIGDCAEIGVGIAASITEKGKQLAENLENTMEGMSHGVKQMGDDYLSYCRANTLEAVEWTAASAGELFDGHIERTVGLLKKTKIRFEGLVKEAGTELRKYVNDHPDSIMTAMDDLGSGYLDMFDNMKETSEKLIAETEEKMRMFADEMESNTTREIKRSMDGMDAVENMVGKIENDIIPQIEGRLEAVLNEFRVEYGRTTEIKGGCERIMSKGSDELAELRGTIEDRTRDMESSIEQLFVSVENDTGKDLDVVLEELESGTEKVLSGSDLEDTVEGLKKELEAKTDELKGRKDEIDRIGEGARESLTEAAGELKKSSEKISESGRSGVQNAISEASAMGAAVKDVGSGMTEKLNEAVSVVKAAGETGKAGMEAVKAAGVAGGGKPGSDSSAGGQTGGESDEGGQTEVDRTAGDQIGGGSAADEQTGDGGTADGRAIGDRTAVDQTGDVSAAAGRTIGDRTADDQMGIGSAAADRTGSDMAAGEQAGADAVPEEMEGTDIEGYEDNSSYGGSSPDGKTEEEFPGKRGEKFAAGESISASSRETISAPEPSGDASEATDGRSDIDRIGTDEIPPEEPDGKITGSALKDHPSADHPDGDSMVKGEIPERGKENEEIGIPGGHEIDEERELPRTDDEGEPVKPSTGEMAGRTSDTQGADEGSIPIQDNEKEAERPGIRKARKKGITDDIEG